LQGPKIRIGKFKKPPILLNPGDLFTITTEDILGNEHIVGTSYKKLADDVKAGDFILVNDGLIKLKVLEKKAPNIFCEVINGGSLYDRRGINLPGVKISEPSLTAKDKDDLRFGLDNGIDLVALSFVRDAESIYQLREFMGDQRVPIVAKLEKPEALNNQDAIIEAANIVMVARGDLGVEICAERVPVVQKLIIEKCLQAGKSVITATQMLDSMIHNPRPTRAEASDVANAIFDGTDAVMLSGETAMGKYPVEAVRMMDAIVRTAEANLERWGHWRGVPGDEPRHDDALSLAIAARELAHDRDVAGIAVFTQTGRTAVLMAKTRPRVPILAFTPEERTYRRLAMHWGIIPYRVPFADTVERMLRHVETGLRTATHIETGEQVVVVAGFPVGAMRPPNFLLLHTVGQIP